MSDTALDAAKAEALDEEVVEIEGAEEEAVEIEEVEEEIVDEEIEETDEEGLPTDHKERSNLGRKVSALLNKSDKQDEILARTWEVIQAIAPKKEPEYDYTNDEPVTKGELLKMEQAKENKQSAYENDFKKSFKTLAEEAELSEQEMVDVSTILFEKHNFSESDNGTLDGAKAFQRSLNDYRATKTPLQHKAPGRVITKQKTKSKQKPLEKLDAVSQSYYNSIVRDRGKEAAEKVHRTL